MSYNYVKWYNFKIYAASFSLKWNINLNLKVLYIIFLNLTLIMGKFARNKKNVIN